MTANSGEFPKIDGDYNYGADSNKAFGLYVGLEQLNIAATQTNGNASYAVKKMYHLIQNTGTNKVYINFDTAATTSSFQVNPGESIEVYGISAQINAICDTGLTTTVRILGMGDTTTAANLSVGIINATSANASLTLATGAVLALAKNAGSKNAFININGAATTSHIQIGPGVKIYFPKNTMTTLQAITAGSDTTNICVISAAIV